MKQIFQRMFWILHKERMDVIRHNDRSDKREALAIEMAQRMIDNFCVIVLSKDARTVASIEPALDRSGEAPVILLLSLRIPRFAMKSPSCGAFLLPACPQTSRDGISQSKSDEVCRAFLLPMRQEILREPNLLVRVEEPQ